MECLILTYRIIQHDLRPGRTATPDIMGRSYAGYKHREKVREEREGRENEEGRVLTGRPSRDKE